ncbi:MAG: hydroxylamine reductase [Candidatus Omnitrophica bacterium]|nr:hydroxylamine reductase [Candidatus Omnitrophota bacterium]
MSMFCFQCQEAASGTGCKIKGACGKTDTVANLQDLLIFVTKGIAVWAEKARTAGAPVDHATGKAISTFVFTTITNANFDEGMIIARIREALTLRDAWRVKALGGCGSGCGCSCGSEVEALSECATWSADTDDKIRAKAAYVGILTTTNEDVRSLRELMIYGLKGVAAYAHHAAELGYEDQAVYDHMVTALAATTKDLSADVLVGLVMKTGECAVTTLALLDKANTTTYGKPEITKVALGVRKNPGILISGHDLRDLEDLLEETKGSGVDVYTHSEMLPAQYYPKFKAYAHLAGNYGGSWWHQNEDFEHFNGPVLMTTNCIIPVKGTYLNRLFTTGAAGYPGAAHIADRAAGKRKDFSALIALAKTCPSPKEIETGEIVGGFAHDQILALADKVVAAVKSGAIKRFVVMAGCDGRMKGREYFTDVAKTLPKDTVILTAGCAKYRYNKLPLGDIGGIPRVLDAGQCNDSYSLAVVALKLKEVFGFDDINKLPISYDIAWYEQKAVAVLLALLYLGVKNIRLGPTLPAFLSPGVAKVLIEKFDIKGTGTAEADVQAMMAGV